MITISRDDVYKSINGALEKLFRDHGLLFEIAVSERAICHRLAIELEPHFPGYNVDCEYNREGLEPKSVERMELEVLDTESKQLNPTGDPDLVSVYPDIVVHTRGSNLHNLLAIEVKKSSVIRGTRGAEYDRYDRAKLAAYRNPRGLRYQYGCYIVVPVGDNYLSGQSVVVDLIPEG